MPRVSIVLALSLLVGTLLLAGGASQHPMLVGDAASNLRIIGAAAHWRAIHLSMISGVALIIVGLGVRLATARDEPLALVLVPLAVIALGEAMNALDIAYMAGAGWRMASLYAQGHAEMSTLYDVTHPIALMAARFGNGLVALGALGLGWLDWRDPTRPRWLAVLAWIAAAGGLVGVSIANEASMLTLAAVALLCGWQAATAWYVLTSHRERAVA